MKVINMERKFKFIVPLVIARLFRSTAAKHAVRPILIQGLAMSLPEWPTYPSLHYERQSQRTMLVEDTGALTKKRKGAWLKS